MFYGIKPNHAKYLRPYSRIIERSHICHFNGLTLIFTYKLDQNYQNWYQSNKRHCSISTNVDTLEHLNWLKV